MTAYDALRRFGTPVLISAGVVDAYFLGGALHGDPVAASIGFLALVLAFFQWSSAERQSTIVENQEKELRKKAALYLHAADVQGSDDGLVVRLYVLNKGQRIARLFKLHLYFRRFAVPTDNENWLQSKDDLDVFSASYQRDFEVICYPNYRSELSPLQLQGAGVSLESIAYRLVYEDGITPSVHGALPLLLRP